MYREKKFYLESEITKKESLNSARRGEGWNVMRIRREWEWERGEVDDEGKKKLNFLFLLLYESWSWRVLFRSSSRVSRWKRWCRDFKCGLNWIDEFLQLDEAFDPWPPPQQLIFPSYVYVSVCVCVLRLLKLSS